MENEYNENQTSGKPDDEEPLSSRQLPTGEDVCGEHKNPNKKNHPQYIQQGEWLEEERTYKDQLLAQGISPKDLMEVLATRSLEHKISMRRQHRCANCWHPSKFCICQNLAPLRHDCHQVLVDYDTTGAVSRDVQILLWMHHKEYFAGGNSAKLLLSLLPQANVKLYIFGKMGEMDRLVNEILRTANDDDEAAGGPLAILWPGKQAMTVSEFLAEKCGEEKGTLDQVKSTPLRFLVIDGTYNKARNMYKSLRKRLGGPELMPCTVKVEPSTASIFHRAQGNYGVAHQQDTDGVRRVSTAEACGLLLTELLGDDTIEKALVSAVQLNNNVLAAQRGEGSQDVDDDN